MTKMTRIERIGTDRHWTALVSLMTTLILSGPNARAQNEPLGDVARQARTERKQEAAPAATEASRLAAELEQEQEVAGSAPESFQNYTAEGYRVAVPAPFSVEGRDDAGVLLATADVTGITTKVFAANPIAVNSKPGEVEFQELAHRFWGRYGSITCEKPKTGMAGHQCTVFGALFGNRVNGPARFLEGDGRIVPVVCFATTLVNQYLDYSIRRRTPEELDNLRADGMRNMERQATANASHQLCNTVLDSIHLKEEYGRPQTALRTQAGKASPKPYQEVSAAGTSLGDIARQARMEAAQQEKAHVTVEAEDTINTPPPGFRIHSHIRCAQACWQETFFLPERARHVKGGNSDNVYVVTHDDTTSVVIYFGGSTVSGGYTEFGMAQDIARRWLHALGDWGADVTHLTGKANGDEVDVVRSRLAANMNVWTEEDVLVERDGINFSIGCIAREDHFADVESLCSTIWESWRIHR
jgi:hypothetical protein